MNKYHLTNQILHESKDDPINKLMKLMSPIGWGWYGTDRKIHREVTDIEGREEYQDGNNWWHTYNVMSPQEVWKHKIGTCIDQSIFQQHWLRENAPEIETTLLWIQQYHTSDHMWMTFKRDNKIYYFEHAWGDRRGIYGPFRTLEDTVKQVYKWGDIQKGYQWKKVGTFKWKPNINSQKYLKMMGYDYSKEEWEDDAPDNNE